MSLSAARHAVLSIVLLLACGDDDSSMSPTIDAATDAALEDSAIEDSAVIMDATVSMDGALHSGRDSALPPVDNDAGDAAICELVPFAPLDGYYEDDRSFLVTRIPSEPRSERRMTLAEFYEHTQCEDIEDDAGFDEGDGGVFWVRHTGCGRVQFELLNSWPRYLSYDAESGALLGLLGVDDVATEHGPCVTADWLYGDVLEQCEEEDLAICD